MLSRVILLSSMIILFIIPNLVGCGKEKDVPIAKEKKEEQPSQSKDIPSDIPIISGEPRTVIPEDIRKKWKGIRFVVEDRERKSIGEYSINIGDEFMIPKSKLVIKVIEFLPDLKIDERREGTIFTSETAELKNPAVHVAIKEDGRALFKGWLFSLFPDIHPFKHERFGIILKEPIPAT